MEFEEIYNASNDKLEDRKTDLWDMIVGKFDGTTDVVSEICEIERTLTYRETG